MEKVKVYDIGGEVVKEDDRYTVYDNKTLTNLILSRTVLHYGKSTSGHAHPGQEEVYVFVYGQGEMQVGDKVMRVVAGDIVLIPDGAFHRVHNNLPRWEKNTDLEFICVFDGQRNH